MRRREDNRKQKKGMLGNLVRKAVDGYGLYDIGLPNIQTRGNREVSVDGCKGILEYEQGRIRLNTGKLIITFIGEGIEIEAYSVLQTVITGNIVSIEFEGNTEG